MHRLCSDVDQRRKIRHIPPHEAQGPTIRQARTSQGLSQQQLGQAIGRTQPYVCMLEHNLRCASGRTARALEVALGIPSLPLPKMLPEQHALGRLAISESRRQAAEQKNREWPRLVPFYPQGLARWGFGLRTFGSGR